MIRADLANRLQPAADRTLRPALPLQELSSRLPGLVAGQRLLAEIESLLPDGNYRAMINQRSVTLSLPFAASSGDAIELEVAESDGKLTLAVVAKAAAEANGGAAVATHLSRTGQLISNLLGGTGEAASGPPPLPLNEQQPIAARPPSSAQDLLPLLQQAISESGMFYESHQAEWVEGRYQKAQLLQEPQGKLTPQVAPASDVSGSARATADAAQLPIRPSEVNTLQTTPPAAAVAPAAQALVQQQLEAFATQNFAWQGQVWPGQAMQWEIQEPGERPGDRREPGSDDRQNWQTRLRLTLPNLGEVDARLQIQGDQIRMSLFANEPAQELLRNDAGSLRSQFQQAGLDLASIGIAAPAASEEQPQPAE